MHLAQSTKFLHEVWFGQQRQWLSDRFDDQNGDDNCMEANGREYFKNDYLERKIDF